MLLGAEAVSRGVLAGAGAGVAGFAGVSALATFVAGLAGADFFTTGSGAGVWTGAGAGAGAASGCFSARAGGACSCVSAAAFPVSFGLGSGPQAVSNTETTVKPKKIRN